MELKLHESTHPNNDAESAFESLIAIDEQKNVTLNTLHLLVDKKKVNEWHKKHHKSKLTFLGKITDGLPLIILEGDVGCGKTALANCIATPLGKLIDKRVKCFETPSNIRGAGKVGEISNRITQAFDTIKAQLGKSDPGILIIDEADDLATSREQNQAHHEDRAGLNVLLKQIDSIVREGYQIIVILITNRLSVLDPAIIRRASKVVQFNRPDNEQRKKVFNFIFDGIDLNENELQELVIASAPKNDVAYSFSDIIQKVGKQAIFKAIQENIPFTKDLYINLLDTTAPSPALT
jgi:SpoVK/Ycf46/Vps4 family AAA+-type ATPase